MHAFVQLNFWL